MLHRIKKPVSDFCSNHCPEWLHVWLHPEIFHPHRIHPWRWRFFTLWIIVVTVSLCIFIRDQRELTTANKNSIQELNRNRVKVTSLQKTNCGLKVFLLTARRARWDQYRKSKDVLDLNAVKGYENLVKLFLSESSTGVCDIPASVIIPQRPLKLLSQGGPH